jgi:hypothetical protein
MKKAICFVLCCFFASLAVGQDYQLDSLPADLGQINWRFQKGDNFEWAKPDFEDSEWQTIKTEMFLNELIPQMFPKPTFWDNVYTIPRTYQSKIL